jgi:hypothetical protein
LTLLAGQDASSDEAKNNAKRRKIHYTLNKSIKSILASPFVYWMVKKGKQEDKAYSVTNESLFHFTQVSVLFFNFS